MISNLQKYRLFYPGNRMISFSKILSKKNGMEFFETSEKEICFVIYTKKNSDYF